MASAPTYTPIATQTLGSSTATVTFSSIPQTYTDLVISMNVAGTNTSYTGITIQAGNGSVLTSGYSQTALSGSGSAASSSRITSNANWNLNRVSGFSSEQFGAYIVNVMNYSNTSTYKTMLERTNITTGSGAGVEVIVGLLQSSSAINIITLSVSGMNFASGSTFTLYGILAA
jgi:hypothetical protein